MKHLILFFLVIIFLAVACKEQSKEKKNGSAAVDESALTEQNACLFSQIAYCNDITTALTTYMPGWKMVWEANELGGNHAFVATNSNEYALAIRGSLINFSWAAFQNWIYQDLHVTSQEKWLFTNDSSDAKLSQGSFDGWQNLNKMTDKKTGQLLLPFLEKELKENSRLLITGHSLGGNLATVYASYLWQSFKKKQRTGTDINVITFAAPAAGNGAFAGDFDKKFPQSIRVENEYDIVPKFPCASRISSLGDLFNDSLPADNIMVGYKNITVSLNKVFTLINTAMTMMEFTSGISAYAQTNGNGKQIQIPLSGKNNGADIINWLSEAGYHHGIAQYAAYEKVPVVQCGQ
jgi:triacylglycerol lipase